jgi:diguanylate cyclase (GGDEF)-like protein
LLDPHLRAKFINRAGRALLYVSDNTAAGNPHIAELIHDASKGGPYDTPPDGLKAYVSRRMSVIRAGDSLPVDVRLRDGLIVRSQCAVLPGGGRMLTYSNVTDLVRNAESLERLASTDGLTGLYNRRHFSILAQAEWTRFQRYGRPLSLLLLDIDHFKSVNDKCGHQFGDIVLAEIARVCHDAKRDSDILARMGGEEFALLLPETGRPDACNLAERLRQGVRDTVVRFADRATSVTVSIGAAEATLGTATFDILMTRADDALYDAKRNGRDRVVANAASPKKLELAAE